MFPEEFESWRGIDRSLFALSSHIQAHCCSLCCASFTDRHTSIRVELGQRVRLVFVFACVDKNVRACLHQTETEKEDNEKKKIARIILGTSGCIYMCVSVRCIWPMENGPDLIQQLYNVSIARKQEQLLFYSCVRVCVHMCVWLGGRE